MKHYELIIAAFGVAVTATLGLGQWRLGQQQNTLLDAQTRFQQQRAVDDIEVRTMALVSPYLSSLGDQSVEGERAEKVVLAAAEFLTNDHGRTVLARMVSRILEPAPSVEQSVKTRIEEATQQAPISTPWFSVLASLPGDQRSTAEEVANNKYQLIRAIDESLSVTVYKTKISNNYAVVVGGSLKKAEALSLARRARESHWADDSFAQRDREWTKEGDAPFN
jgi:hypothetical protein